MQATRKLKRGVLVCKMDRVKCYWHELLRNSAQNTRGKIKIGLAPIFYSWPTGNFSAKQY